MTRLTRTDIINWADTKDAEGQLPELIRRLVVVSNPSIDTIVMPYGNSVGRSGLDGFVSAGNASRYVAAGGSVWEFGRNTDHVKKANQDFVKRTDGTAPFRQQELTYHCVTPRHWEAKANWESNPGPRKSPISHSWKMIRVYDVDDLLGWLSECPTVEAWFARILGKATAGLRDVQGYWANVAKIDAGILETKVLLAGREQLAQQLHLQLAGNTKALRPLGISSRAPAEVVPFAVASLVDCKDDNTIARTAVVDSRSRWEQLIVEESELGLIVAPQVQPTREELQQAFRCGHRIVYCADAAELELPRLAQYELREALISSGIGEAEATQHALQCGGDGQLLLDRLSNLHAAAGQLGSRLDDRVKVACLLLVAWNGESAADREAFTMIAGLPYEDIEASLVADSNSPNGLLFRADGKFRLLSPELAWVQHARLITKSVTQRFAEVVQYVLADEDPTAGMAGVERLVAQFQGKCPEFSRTLRSNVVHSLAIAGSIGSARLNLDPSMSPSFVDWIVRSTLKNASFRRWASFGGELSILAEAAPDALLDSMATELRPDGMFAKIMAKTETDLFSSPAHTGVLWALERLCWSPEHLQRAIAVLFGLAKLNPDIKSGNNPTNSIRETLQLTCPQTNADWATRQSAISTMLKTDAGMAFPLVISLFPTGMSSWLRREMPTWRNWAYGYVPGTKRKQISVEIRWCIEQLLLFACDEAEHWSSLLELCGTIDDRLFESILNGYESALASGAFDDLSKRLLWETINAFLVRLDWNASRRRLSDGRIVDVAEASEPDSQPHFPGQVRCHHRFASRLKNLLAASVPQDPVLAGCHAFMLGLGRKHFSSHFSDRFNYEKQQRNIEAARRAIVEGIFQREGLVGLQRLAALANVDSAAVGGTASSVSAKVGINCDQFIALLSSPGEADRNLASGFIGHWAWERQHDLPQSVLPYLAQISSEETQVLFLRCLPPQPGVWDWVDRQNQAFQQSFWKHARLPWEVPTDRVSYFVNKLVQANRADRAVDFLSHRREIINETEVESVFAALEGLLHVTRDADEGTASLRWEIQQLFDVLYKLAMSQVQRLVRLELIYHQSFEKSEGLRFQPKGLLAAIRDTPSLFVDMLSYLWKDDTGKSGTPDDDASRNIAGQVRGLLSSLAELPGQSELCSMSEKNVADWVAEIIRHAKERGYLTALQLQIPEIVTSDAWDAFDTWPASAIGEALNLIDEIDPDNFRRHLAASLSNARGFHSVDPTGQTEKSQAEKLRRRARELRDACPSVAWALTHIAQDLDEESSRNIERANWEL